MSIRETVRSGRRENFYVTDNSFIDHYARELQPTDIAVYHALERYANCHTRSTWVGTAKIAEVLNVSQRTVQRSLKALEDLKLIRIVQTSTMKVYFIVPVPARAKTSTVPLFDGIEEKEFSLEDDGGVVWPTPPSSVASTVSRMPPAASPLPTLVTRGRDSGDGAYKEEQDLFNKTQEQDLFNKNLQSEKNEIENLAQRILSILKLPETHMNAAIAAVEEKRRLTKLSTDGIVQDIATAANRAERLGVERQEFLEDFLAEQAARRILRSLHSPITNNVATAAKAAIKAEVPLRGSVEEAAAFITNAAIDDMGRGVLIDRFYFEGAKWRSNVRSSKAEQRKLDNLDVNARAKQRLREKLGIF